MEEDTCELAAVYPGSKGPVHLAFNTDEGSLVACGTIGDKNDLSCRSFDGSAWTDLPAKLEKNCQWPSRSVNAYLPGLGWLVLAQSKYCDDADGVKAELLAAGKAVWTRLYGMQACSHGSVFPDSACLVALNDTSLLMTGGRVGKKPSTKACMYDAASGHWTQVADMPLDLFEHGCALTPEGEVLVGGGQFRGTFGPRLNINTYIYNPVTKAWRRNTGRLPKTVFSQDFSKLFLANGKNFLVENLADSQGNDRIWARLADGSWEETESKMGASFNGEKDYAVLVPADFAKCK